MAIRIYSDKTQKFYNTVEEANRAEFEAKEAENRQKILAERKAAEEKARKEKEAAERKALAADVETARKNMINAQKAYKDVLSTFCKKYGSYHYTTSSFEDIPTLFGTFDDVLRKLL